MPRAICVVTSTRADYGLLYWVMRRIQDEPSLRLQIVATGMHLAPQFGTTANAVEQDGFQIDERVEMLLASDSPVGVAKSLGLGVIGMADALARLHPDLLLLLGDRFEILAAAEAALILKIPVAHIAGGDTTEGAFDEAIRHSITKMSHVHFATNEPAAARLRQLGEDPRSIHVSGSPGIDTIRCMPLLNRQELERAIGFRLRKRNLLITFHPATLEEQSAAAQMEELLVALSAFDEETGLLFTKPNADPEGQSIARMVDQFVSAHSNAGAWVSLGQLNYLSAMAMCDVVVGNSSSGLYEAPSFRKPTVNIGDRQRGRLAAPSVVQCQCRRDAIAAAIERAMTLDCTHVVNPYGDGHAAERIVSTLRDLPDPRQLLRKKFYDSGEDRCPSR